MKTVFLSLLVVMLVATAPAGLHAQTTQGPSQQVTEPGGILESVHRLKSAATMQSYRTPRTRKKTSWTRFAIVVGLGGAASFYYLNEASKHPTGSDRYNKLMATSGLLLSATGFYAICCTKVTVSDEPRGRRAIDLGVAPGRLAVSKSVVW